MFCRGQDILWYSQIIQIGRNEKVYSGHTDWNHNQPVHLPFQPAVPRGRQYQDGDSRCRPCPVRLRPDAGQGGHHLQGFYDIQHHMYPGERMDLPGHHPEQYYRYILHPVYRLRLGVDGRSIYRSMAHQDRSRQSERRADRPVPCICMCRPVHPGILDDTIPSAQVLCGQPYGRGRRLYGPGRGPDLRAGGRPGSIGAAFCRRTGYPGPSYP